MSKSVLEGIKVLEFAHVLAAPFSGCMLGDLGAEVIKIEKCDGGDSTRQMGPPFQKDQTPFFQSVNRNKKSFAVSLKDPRGIDAVLRLVKDADVLIENFRPGVMDRLGLGYERLREVNSGLIYMSMTAFGDKGPYKDLPGYELIVQALTGMVYLSSAVDGAPRKVQPQVVDLGAGIVVTVGILAALFHRARTGQGQHVKTNLLQASAALLCNFYSKYAMDGTMPPQGLDSRSDFLTPSQAYKTADGYFVTVCAGRLWLSFCEAVGKPAWKFDEHADPAWRKRHVLQLEKEVQEITTKQTTAYWLKQFKEHDVPISKVNTPAEFMDTDPQAKAMGVFASVDHPTAGKIGGLVSAPWEFSASPCAPVAPPPLLGEQTDEILKSLGYGDEQIAALKSDNVVA